MNKKTIIETGTIELNVRFFPLINQNKGEKMILT